jgi:hypothetical protein
MGGAALFWAAPPIFFIGKITVQKILKTKKQIKSMNFS